MKFVDDDDNGHG